MIRFFLLLSLFFSLLLAELVAPLGATLASPNKQKSTFDTAEISKEIKILWLNTNRPKDDEKELYDGLREALNRLGEELNQKNIVLLLENRPDSNLHSLIDTYWSRENHLSNGIEVDQDGLYLIFEFFRENDDKLVLRGLKSIKKEKKDRSTFFFKAPIDANGDHTKWIANFVNFMVNLSYVPTETLSAKAIRPLARLNGNQYEVNSYNPGFLRITAPISRSDFELAQKYMLIPKGSITPHSASQYCNLIGMELPRCHMTTKEICEEDRYMEIEKMSGFAIWVDNPNAKKSGDFRCLDRLGLTRDVSIDEYRKKELGFLFSVDLTKTKNLSLPLSSVAFHKTKSEKKGRIDNFLVWTVDRNGVIAKWENEKFISLQNPHTYFYGAPVKLKANIDFISAPDAYELGNYGVAAVSRTTTFERRSRYSTAHLVTISSDSKVAGFSNGLVKNIARDIEVKIPSWVEAVAHNQSTNAVAAGDSKGNIYIYNNLTMKSEPTHIFKAFSAPIRVLEFSNNGKFLYAGAQKGSLLIIDTETGQVAKELSDTSVSIEDIYIEPDGAYMAVASGDGAVNLYDLLYLEDLIIKEKEAQKEEEEKLK